MCEHCPCETKQHSVLVVSPVASQQKVLGSNPGPFTYQLGSIPSHSRTFLCVVCMCFPCLRWFPPGTPEGLVSLARK